MTLSVVSGRGYLSPNRASGVAALRLGYGYRVGKDRKLIVQLQPYCSLAFTPTYDSASKRFFFLFTGASLSIFSISSYTHLDAFLSFFSLLSSSLLVYQRYRLCFPLCYNKRFTSKPFNLYTYLSSLLTVPSQWLPTRSASSTLTRATSSPTRLVSPTITPPLIKTFSVCLAGLPASISRALPGLT